MKSLTRCIAKLSLGLSLGAALGACKDDPDLEDFCANKVGLIASCAETTFDCEMAPCYDDCTVLGEAAKDFSEACGALWIEIYGCFADMSCEGVDAWAESLNNDTFDYPCGKLESKFRKTCPDVPLYGPNS